MARAVTQKGYAHVMDTKLADTVLLLGERKRCSDCWAEQHVCAKTLPNKKYHGGLFDALHYCIV